MNPRTRAYQGILTPSDVRWVPKWNAFAAMAEDGEIVKGETEEAVRREVADRNLHSQLGFQKLSISGVNVQ